MKNKTWLRFPVIQAAALIQVAARSAWSTVLLTAGIALTLLWLPQCRYLPGWLRGMEDLWSGILIGQVLRWFTTLWPGNPDWIGISLLLLALWQTAKGKRATAAAASVLGIFQLLLIAGVLLVGLQNLRPEGLRPEPPQINGGLLAMLLLPALGCPGERRSVWPVLWALLICLVVRGVLPPNGVGGEGNAFWEMSRSISVFGKIRRMEGLTAVGLSIGFYTLVCHLLGEAQSPPIGAVVPACIGGVIFLMGYVLPDGYAAVGSIVLWVILPLFTGFVTKQWENRTFKDVLKKD